MTTIPNESANAGSESQGDGSGVVPTVFVVDDDAAVRDSLRWLIESVRLRVMTFESAAAFIEAFDPEMSGCLVVDIRLPGMSGLDLLERIHTSGGGLPAIVITGYGDVPATVRAFKSGAVDLLEKPFSDQQLLDCIHKAIQRDVSERKRRRMQVNSRARFDRLTPRELEVMLRIVDGCLNKQIAADLAIAEKTVETHRARVMEKTEADSVADLVRMAVAAGFVSA